MTDLDKATQTQLANIEKRTGKTLAQLGKLIKASGLTKHGEIRDMLKSELGMGHGDANTLVHVVLKSAAATGATPVSANDAVAGYYSGPKAALRPIHDKVMAAIEKFGPFEIAPKKTYVSLRRKKQFAMVGPATKTQVEIGFNMKGVKATARLVQLPAGQMCNYKLRLSSVAEVDAELISWLRTAYDSAG